MDQERNESIKIELDGIAFSLREEADFSWLRGYGKVFWVQDQLTSGNLCFGVEGPYGKLFIKYAGAQPVNYAGRPEDAVYILQNAIPIYQECVHGALNELRAHGRIGQGYAAIFTWQEGKPLRPIPSEDDQTLQRVRRLQVGRSLRMLDGIFDFHALAASAGYIDADPSETNLLIDFDRDAAVVCDIDLYRKKPAFNDRGRMPGSSLLMAPEEYTLGAPLDESTSVYHLGALAFTFYGDNTDRTRSCWHGPAALFDVAEKATRDKREERYPSVRSFVKNWREAVGKSTIR